MPVAKDFHKADPNKAKRIFAELPGHIHKEQKIPTKVQQVAIGKMLAYNGLWLVLTYGADLLSMAVPWLGKGVGALIKLRFKGRWEQKQINL